MIGEIINERFLLCEKLGEGGMAVVYRAKDVDTEQESALKMMKTSLTGTSQRRFAREFRAIGSVDHPNCIKVFQFAETAEFPFFTMELFPGKPITTLIGSQLPIILAALYQAVAAVEYVHSSQIIHRDLKPSNLLVHVQHDPDNQPQVIVKLADFGLARFYGTPSSLSVDSGFVGTLAYSAPEQISSGAIDHRCDLYSLGVVCYELLTGRHPFEAARDSGMQALIRAHLAELPLPLRAANANVPADIEDVVLALLNKQPSKRPQSAAVLKQILARHLDITDGPADLSSTAIYEPNRPIDTFVAREKELAAVSRMMTDSLSPLQVSQVDDSTSLEPSVVFVTGDAGMGKSHFLREVARLARRHGADVFEGRCFEGNLAPYQPFVEIVRQLLSQLGKLDTPRSDIPTNQLAAARVVANETATLLHNSNSSSESVGDVVRNYAAELLRIAPDLRTWLPGKAFRQVDLSREANYVLRAIATFFVDLATLHGTCLLIEDLHWADQSSLDLLRHIASILHRNREQSAVGNRSCPRLFICCTSRPATSGIEQVSRELERERYAKVVDLKSLSKSETRQLVAMVLGAAPEHTSNELIEQVVHRCKGNPYFITESVRTWQSGGKVVRSKGQWALDTSVDSTTQWPDSVRGVLRSRLESVSASAGQVLGPCAVIGPIVDVDVLRQSVGDIRENDFLDAVDELLARQVLFESSNSRFLEFSHDLLRELTYEQLSGSRRRALHRRVGEVLEQTGAARETPEQLAGHFYEARVPERAFPYLLAACETALASYAIDDALRHLNRALEFEREIDDQRPKLRLHELFATAHSAAGRPTEALESHHRRLALATDRIETGRILQQIGELHFRIGDFDAAIDVFDRSLQQVGYRRPRSRAAVVASTGVSLFRHAWPRWLRVPVPGKRRQTDRVKVAHSVFSTLELLWAQRNVLNCGQAHGRHLVLASQLGDPAYLTHACARQALIFGIFSLNGLALRAGRRALAIAKQAGDAEGEAIAKGHVGCAHYFGGRLIEAEKLLREAVVVLDRRGDSWERMYFYHNLRHLYSIVGDTEQEVESARVEMQIGEAVNDPEGTCWGAYGIANALARSGKFDEAHQYMQRALGIVSGRTNIVVLPTALQTYGYVHLQSGDFTAAREVLEESCKNIRRDWAFIEYTVRSYPLLVESLLGPRWHDASARLDEKLLCRSWKLSRYAKFWAWRFPNYMPHALRVRGRAAAALGKEKKAADCFLHAMKVGESIGARYDVARAYIDLSKLGVDGHVEHARRGHQILADIGAVVPECEQ